jgi:NitT/TauT family transport system ATP-binding protein
VTDATSQDTVKRSAAGGGASISISHVSMTYQSRGVRVDALKDVSLDIAAGSFVSVLGPSGCGKSTLMMLAAGLYRPSSGELRVDGKLLDDCYTEAGIVFQTDVLLPWLSILDNVLMPARIKNLNIEAAAERGRALLAQVGLSGFEKHYPGELSGGMRQRAAICRALLSEPSALLMDEPFGALDALTRERMQTDINRLWAEHRKTVLLITHDIEEAVLLSDEVVVMSPRPGRILSRFQVDLPQPREPAIRRDPRFHRIVDDIRALFQQAGVL